MNHKKRFILSLIVIMSMTGCYRVSNQVSKNIKEQKINFGKVYLKSGLLSQFPEKIKGSAIITYESSPPSCPPSFKCRAQFGEIHLILNKQGYEKEISKLINEGIAYRTPYSDSNIIINLSELRGNIFPVEKCNKWYPDKLPIPYFESIDFGLGGKKETKKEVNGKTYFDYTYAIPPDLNIYVITAESGDFWKENCNEKRPESLRNWKHGYSKGFAISDKDNLIIYWTMIW